MNLIRALQSGFEAAKELEPLEEKIGKYENSLFELQVKEAVDGLSTEEISQKTQLEKKIADVGKKRDSLASKLKKCCEVLEERELYIKGLVEMIRKYKEERRFYRVELDGTVVEKAQMPKWFDIFNDPNSETTTQPKAVSGTATQNATSSGTKTTTAPGATTTQNRVANLANLLANRLGLPNTAGSGTATKAGTGTASATLKSKINLFNNTAPKTAPVVAPTHLDRVQKWKNNGKKIKYLSSAGFLSERIDPNERTLVRLPLSTSDPKTAKALEKGEEANKDAVERFILNGRIDITEEADSNTGLGTGKYYVRFQTRPAF